MLSKVKSWLLGYQNRVQLKDKLWPQLVGKTVEQAQHVILSANPTYDIEIIHPRYCVNLDWRSNRVRIYINKLGIVTQVPKIG